MVRVSTKLDESRFRLENVVGGEAAETRWSVITMTEREYQVLAAEVAGEQRRSML